LICVEYSTELYLTNVDPVLYTWYEGWSEIVFVYAVWLPVKIKGTIPHSKTTNRCLSYGRMH